MKKKKLFLKRFYDDKAKQVIMQCALSKAIRLDKKRRIKQYSDMLNELEKNMSEYIARSRKAVKKINFLKEGPKYRIDEEKQKALTLEIIGKELTIDELQVWAEGKTWEK